MRNTVMTSNNDYQPRAEHKNKFGLWTIGNRARDAFGDAVRPHISPIEIVSMLAEVGAWGVNLHDNDLVPIDATAAERDAIVRSFKKACDANGIVIPMATVSLFFHPVFRDGAFTANDPEVRAYAVQKTLRAMDLGALETDYAFSRFLSLSTILQVDTANAQAASANIRLRWNYRPDSDLYVIYTAGQKFASLAAVSPAQFYENRFAIKFTYSWRP